MTGLKARPNWHTENLGESRPLFSFLVLSSVAREGTEGRIEGPTSDVVVVQVHQRESGQDIA